MLKQLTFPVFRPRFVGNRVEVHADSARRFGKQAATARRRTEWECPRMTNGWWWPPHSRLRSQTKPRSSRVETLSAMGTTPPLAAVSVREAVSVASKSTDSSAVRSKALMQKCWNRRA